MKTASLGLRQRRLKSQLGGCSHFPCLGFERRTVFSFCWGRFLGVGETGLLSFCALNLVFVSWCPQQKTLGAFNISRTKVGLWSKKRIDSSRRWMNSAVDGIGRPGFSGLTAKLAGRLSGCRSSSEHRACTSTRDAGKPLIASARCFFILHWSRICCCQSLICAR